MKTGGFVVGASAGLLFALMFVGGASLLGPAASHIDLIHAVAPSTTQRGSGLSTPSSVQVTTAPTDQVTTEGALAPTTGPSISSVSALATDSGASLGLLFLPILVGTLIGALFYGLFTRRADVE
jgi:hypothetical protein